MKVNEDILEFDITQNSHNDNIEISYAFLY